MRSWTFAKGHGTRNDFVVLVDRQDLLGLTDTDVVHLCDRRAGVGGDGVLRAVKAEHVPQWDGDPALWFMDYRNADASVAEMCGNGLRLFARHLLDEGLVEGPRFEVATRAGLRQVEVLGPGRVRVEMGPVTVVPDAVEVTAQTLTGPRRWRADAVDVGNPHAVVRLATDELAELDLTRAPAWSPAETFPHGVNVEWAHQVEPGRLAMRVHERGSGETASCGTGTVAVAAAHARAAGVDAGRWLIDVPGGRVEVELEPGGSWLTGPAEVVARGEVLLPGG